MECSRYLGRPVVTLAILGCLILPSCGNDNFDNHGVVSGGRRFELVIDPARTAADGTPFLLDTATGDLWTLAPGEAGQRWTRFATGPDDVRPVTMHEILGVTPPS